LSFLWRFKKTTTAMMVLKHQLEYLVDALDELDPSVHPLKGADPV
jgi:hypothetical protein